MRKSSVLFCYLALNTFLLIMAYTHAAVVRKQQTVSLSQSAKLVSTLSLTDLCLFTEARYTRHPSQADLHAPFQDHPLSLEHFPSGSLLTPQTERTAQHADLD